MNELQKKIKFQFTLLETIFFVHTGIIGAVYVLYLLSKGLSIFQANMVSAVFTLTSICLEVPSGAVCDIIGKRRTAIFAGIALFIAMLCFQLGMNIGIIIIGQIFWGMSYSLESGTIEAWAINEGKFKDSEIDIVFASSAKVQSIAMILGSFIGTWFADRSLNLIWFAPMITSLIFIFMVFVFIKEPKEQNKINQISITNLFKSSIANIKAGFNLIISEKKLLYVYNFNIIIAFIFSPLMIFWSVYLKQISNDSSYIYLSFVWVLIQLALVAGNQILEYIGLKYKRKTIFIFSLIVLAISMISMNFIDGFIFATAMILLQELICAVINSSQRGLINNHIDDEKRATMISYSSLFNSLGKVMASVLFGMVADIFSITAAWMTAGIMSLLSIGYIILMYKTIDRKKYTDKNAECV